MLTKTSIGFGILMLIVGVLGFVPGVTDFNGNLLGLFHVNVAHNIIHLLTGLAALACGLDSVKASQIFFRVFGALYGLVAILGFVTGGDMLMGMIANNAADNWLHTVIAIGALVLGFVPSLAPHPNALPHAPPPAPLSH